MALVTGAGESDLDVLLRTLSPKLRDGTWVFATAHDEVPAGCRPVVVVSEDEGTTLVVRREEAERLGLDHEFPCAWISLEVHSALEAVGLTAAVARALTVAGISANIVAGRVHDHVFVPVDRAHEAVRVLRELATSAA